MKKVSGIILATVILLVNPLAAILHAQTGAEEEVAPATPPTEVIQDNDIDLPAQAGNDTVLIESVEEALSAEEVEPVSPSSSSSSSLDGPASPNRGESQEGTTTPATIETQAASEVLVQDTSATQETIPGDSLENTTDPTLLENNTMPTTTPQTTSESSTQASSTPETIIENTPPEVVATLTPEAPEVAMPEIAAVSNTEKLNIVNISPVLIISSEELKPKDKYVFSIKGEKFSAKKIPSWKGDDRNNSKKSEGMINTEATLAIDEEENTLKISGSCSTAYFVILLYKEKEDYDINPASYILNRAYPCIDSRYDYSLSDLPKNLASTTTTYYLLVGEQGETGSWSPISKLQAIDISNQQ